MAFGFFDGQKADASPESIKRRREMIARMLSGNSRAPRNIGEGFQAIGTNLAAAIEGSRADAEEKAGNAERARIMGGIGFGGAPMASAGNPVATGGAAPRAVAAPEQFAPLFAEKEAKYGLPSGYLARTAQIESNFNPNAKNPNSSAGGLFQFINSTARQYGLANRFDPVAATAAAARLASDNRDFLARRLGREPSAGELYLAHQQGAGGAAKLLANPNASASSVVGDAAARLNRGAGMTANAFANQWINKFGTPVVRPGPGATPMPLAQPIQTASAGPQANEGQMQDGAGELQAGGSGLMAEPAVYRGELNNVPAGDLMQRGPMPALPEGFDVSSLITPAGQPSGAQGFADNEEQTRAMEAQMAADQGLPYAGNEPGLLSPVPMGFGPNPFLPREPDAMAQAPAAPAPSMNRATFDQVTAGLDPRAPAFTGRNAGLTPSWAGDAEALAPGAQEASGPNNGPFPTPPPRPADLRPQSPLVPPAMRQPIAPMEAGENGAGAMQFIESEFARREGRPDPRMAIGAPQGYNPFVPQALQAPQMAGDGGSVQGASQGGAMASGAAQPQQAGMITPQNVRAVMSSPFTSDADKRFVMDMWNQQQARAQADAERARTQAQNEAAARAAGLDPALLGNPVIGKAATEAKFREAPETFRDLTPAERTQRGIDPNDRRPYQISNKTGKLSGVGGAQTNVSVNNSAESEFDKKLGGQQAEMFGQMLSSGTQIQSDIADISQLRELVKTAPTGLQGAAVRFAGNLGIPLGEGAGDVQAFEAIVNRLVPAQRPPGSGTMSDRDVDLFKSSLPRLINQPGGNNRILDTMEGMTRYRQAQFEIARDVAAGQLSRRDALDRLSKLDNPLAWVRQQNRTNSGQTGNTTSAPPPSPAQGGFRILRVE
jgi:hypothetical protein